MKNWQNDPVSEKQLSSLLKLMEWTGMKVEKPSTKGEASASLDFLQKILQERKDAKQAEREAALESVEPWTAGHQVVSGKVVSSKWATSDYGETMKMLLEVPSGNRLWLTVPAKLRSQLHGGFPEKGMEVTVSVTVKLSDKDVHFAFGSRPELVS